MLQGRSTVELMVLALTATICVMLLLAGTTVAVVEILNPEVNTDTIVNAMSDILSMILGALLGLLAGRSESINTVLHKQAGGQMDGL